MRRVIEGHGAIEPTMHNQSLGPYSPQQVIRHAVLEVGEKATAR